MKILQVFALNCEEDINKDGISDCLVSGRAGVSFQLNIKQNAIDFL